MGRMPRRRERDFAYTRGRGGIVASVLAITLSVFVGVCLFGIPVGAGSATSSPQESQVVQTTIATGTVQSEDSADSQVSVGDGGAGTSAATKTGTATTASKTSSSSSTSKNDGSDAANEALGTTTLSSALAANDAFGTTGAEIKVNMYVAVDGAWYPISADGVLCTSTDDASYTPITTDRWWEGTRGDMTNPYFITQAQVEAALSKTFRFSADTDVPAGSDWGKFMFAYMRNQPGWSLFGTIWNNITPQKVDGDGWVVYCIANEGETSENVKYGCNLYYLPAASGDYYASGRSYLDSSLLSDNSFHKVTVEDPGHLVYASDADIPAASYIITTAANSKKAVTLAAPGDTVTWQIFEDVDGDGTYSKKLTTANYSFAKSNDGTTRTYTLQDITAPVKFVAVSRVLDSYGITYNAPMDASDLAVYGSLNRSNQSVPTTGNATVEDESVHAVIYKSADGSYTLLAPDVDQVTVAASLYGGDRSFCYAFAGWKITDDGNVYAAGSNLTAAQIADLADDEGNITFKSTWNLVDAQGRINSANFFLDLECEVRDNLTDGFGQQSSGYFTPSIYSSRLSGTAGLGMAGGSSELQLTASASVTNCFEVDKQIRSMASAPFVPAASVTDATYSGDGISFVDFPSDDEVFAKVRAGGYQIKIDGETILTSNITSANFTIRWNVVKYVDGDGWHVDGVLVAKKARLVVKKTFEGDADAIKAVKGSYTTKDGFNEDDDFYIAVSHEDATQGDVNDYELMLISDTDVDHSDNTDRRFGYTDYDEATNTYTWVVDTRQGRTYQIAEKNSSYTSDDTTVKWNNSRWYDIDNSETDSNTAGWVAYDWTKDVEIKVLAAAYPTDVPDTALQTVSFRNLYVHAGVVVVHKSDYVTGKAMAGVKFKVTQEDDTKTYPLYRKGSTNYYTTDTAAASDAEYARVPDNKAETDDNGTFYLELGVSSASSSKIGTYSLVEDKSTALGYEGADSITITVKDEEGITGDIKIEGDSDDVTWAKTEDNKFVLDIVNRSLAYTSVTAKKEWSSDTAVSDMLPVTVQLWRTYAHGDAKIVEPVPNVTDADGNVVVNYTQQLSASNEWYYRWEGLPLFIDNAEVTYSLRETWIGDPSDAGSYSYDVDADASDGYKFYTVTNDVAAYCRSDAAPDISGLTYDEYTALYLKSTPYWTDDGNQTTFANNALFVVHNSEVGRRITFAKKDRVGIDGKPLAGAEFTLYADEACTKELQVKTTGSDGIIKFDKVSSGTYWFKETAAPDGYSFDATDTWRVEVHGETPRIYKVGDASGTVVSAIANKFGAALQFIKCGGTRANVLTGAEFTIEKLSSGDADASDAVWEAFGTVTTNADGEGWLTGIEMGTYRVTETKAPKGYKKQSEPWTFKVDTEDGAIAFTGSATDDTYVSFGKIDDTDTDADADTFGVSNDGAATDGIAVRKRGNGVAYRLVVANVALYSLPTAGGMGVVGITVAGVALMCSAIWFALLRERELKNNGSHAGGERHA